MHDMTCSFVTTLLSKPIHSSKSCDQSLSSCDPKHVHFSAATTELGTCLVNRSHPVRPHKHIKELVLISAIAGKRVLARPLPPERSDDEAASATDISDDGENEM